MPARGIPFHPLPARPLVGHGRGGTGAGARDARRARRWRRARLVRALGADVVLGTGGYVSAPAVLGARLAGRPVLLLEPNARAGVANRWLSRWATARRSATARRARDLRARPG